MTQTFLTVSFFVLSWKWYLFGAFLWAYYFWHRRKHEVTQGASEIDVRYSGRRAYQFGLILVVFAFIVSALTQWIFVASGFLAGGLLGWAMTHYLTRKTESSMLATANDEHPSQAIFLVRLAGCFTLAIVAITKLGNSGLMAVLILWAAGAGYLVAFGLYLLLVKPNLQITA